MLLREQISVSINSFQECLTSFRQITLYSCKESDHQSVAGMHTLMCIVILNSGMCSVDSCIVSDMHRLPSRGNCLEWDSMPTVWVAVLIPQVSIPFQRAQGAQVWGSGNVSISSLDSVLSSNGNGAHHLLGPWLLVSPSWRTINAVLHQQSLLCTHCIFCRQRFLKI